MADRTCEKCGKAFAKPFLLKRHRARKTPCDPIIDAAGDADSTCKYCGRTFTTDQALSRHVLHRCKIANSDEGMNKLMDHTIQRQLEQQNAKIDRLTSLLERQQFVFGALPGVRAEPAAPTAINVGAALNVSSVTNVNAVTNVTNVTNNIAQVTIRPWDGAPADRIDVPLSLIAAAFAENSRLKEYCRLGDDEKTDPKIAPPYVLEMLMDLVRRAHADPAARNVYLNPRRADQALVCLKSGRWEVIQLAEATRLIFDGVVVSIHAVTLSYEKLRELPLEAQNAMAIAGLVYRDEPEEYAKRAKGPMAAHLANTAPGQLGAPAPALVARPPLLPALAPAPSPALAPAPSPALAPAPSPALAPAPSPALASALLPAHALSPALVPTSSLAPAPVPVSAPLPAPTPLPAPPTAGVAAVRRWAAPVQKPPEEKHFAQAEAAALLRANRPPRVGEVDVAYIRRLARLAGVDTGRVVRKLWEAAEDRLLSGDDDQTARAVCSVYDENPDQYD
jgi:hypothetical protein